MTVPSDERRQFALLFENFFKRLFESELLPEGVDAHDALSSLIALFAAPTALVTLWLFPKYALVVDLAPHEFESLSRGDKLFFIGYSMAAVGFLTVLIWESLFPDKRDAVVLGTIPLRPSVVFAARFSALATLVIGFALAVNLLSSLGFAFAAAGASTFSTGLRYVVSHLTATIAAGIFVSLFVVALQTMLFVSLPSSVLRIVSVIVQVAFVIVLVEWVIFAPGLLADVEIETKSSTLLGGSALWLPPLWFLGLYDWLLGVGAGAADSTRLATWAFVALWICFGVATLSYTIGYRIVMRRAMETEDPARKSTRLGALAARALRASVLREPVRFAVMEFIVKSLLRSRRHRLVLSVYLAVGLAFLLAGVLEPMLEGKSPALTEPSGILLCVPLVLSFFAIVALRNIFSIPTELGANWIFRITETPNKHAHTSGVRAAMLGLGLLPLVGLTFPVYAYLWTTWSAALFTAYWLLLGVFLVELVLVGFRKIPFTCTYVPGRANMKLLWPAYLIAAVGYGYGAARLFEWLLRDPVRFFAAASAVAVGIGVTRIHGRLAAGRGAPFTFEERAHEDEVPSLDIGRPA